jgi:hypothetical protein
MSKYILIKNVFPQKNLAPKYKIMYILLIIENTRGIPQMKIIQ